MPHPERASEPLLGSADGRLIFESLIFVAGKPSLIWRLPPDMYISALATMSEPSITPFLNLVKKHNLTPEEFEKIVSIFWAASRLTRRLGVFSPGDVERALFLQRNTRPLLKTFPTKSPRILVGAGRGKRRYHRHRRRPRHRLQKSNPTTTRRKPSNRSKARPPVSAGSSATSSPWVRDPCARSIRYASAQSRGTATPPTIVASSAVSSAESRTMEIVSASRRLPEKFILTRVTRGILW